MRRASFLELTKLNIDNLTNLKRRKLLPFEMKNGEYTLFDAFLTIVFFRFCESGPGKLQLPQSVACKIVKDLVPLLESNLMVIGETARKVRLEPNYNSLYCGRVSMGPGYKGDPYSSATTLFVGSNDDVIQIFQPGADVIEFSVINLSLAAAVFEARARNADIDLRDFWS